MRLWRLDAQYRIGDGSFTKLFRDPPSAEKARQRFVACGWFCDVYVIELMISQVTARKLFDGVWPVMHDAQLAMLADKPFPIARDPFPKAVADLHAIVKRKARHS